MGEREKKKKKKEEEKEKTEKKERERDLETVRVQAGDKGRDQGAHSVIFSAIYAR